MELIIKTLNDDGTFPNSKLPLLYYPGAVLLGRDKAGEIEELFEKNGWSGVWRDGVYTFHHYHSTAHEVLGVFAGSAKLQFGGEHGPTYTVNPGDVVVIAAGVAHKNLGATGDFRVVGAYADGREWDMNYGKAGERPGTDRNIAKVPVPGSDPVYGAQGPLLQHWRGAAN